MKNQQGWADLYAFRVDRKGDTPLFRQIYAQMRSAILSRALRAGAKLPSSRDLALRLAVSRTAVVAAYEQLLAEGYVTGRTGAGTYIAADLPEPFAGTRPKPRKRTPVPGKAAASPARPVRETLDVTFHSEPRPFNLGRTLLDARTVELWRKLTARSLRAFGAEHLGYGDPRGTAALRGHICDYL